MHRLAFVVSAFAMLVFAGNASAYHHYSDFRHWSTEANETTWNCASGEARCVIVIDRTGYGSTWRANVLIPSLVQITGAMAGRMNFSVQVGTRFDVWVIDPNETNPCSGACDGTWHYDELLAQTPAGAISVGRLGGIATWQTMGGHILKAVVGVEKSYAQVLHELGHTMGLNHRKIDANYNCDGYSAMCALGYPRLDAHDREELAFLYGHTD